MPQKSILFLALVFFSAIASAAQQKPNPTPEPARTYYYQLTAKEISDLEAKLKAAPSDYDARTKLINYYAERETPANKKTLQRHRLALIENNPQSKTELYLGTWFEDDFVKPEYIELKNVWLKQISLNPKNKEVRFNAASFFEYDSQLTEKILKEGQIVSPNDFEYSLKLIELYDNPASLNYGESEEIRLNKRLTVLRKTVAEAQKALGLLKKAENLEEAEENILKMLAVSAKYALEIGDLELARKAADELIVKSGDPKMLRSSIFGTEIESFQIAYSVLGRIARRAGNVEKAKEYLLNSLRSLDEENYESPKIDSQFLEEMLVRNGSKNVIEYLELFLTLKHLEDSQKQSIREMIMLLNRGKFPDMGSDLSIY